MDVYEAIEARRSIRSFLDKGVDRATIKKLLEAAIKAPSAGNLQAWRFIVVESTELREELCAAAGGQGFLLSAPVVIAVCADLERAGERYRQRGRDVYAIQGAAAAAENLMLAAVAEGLGTCWVGAFDERMAAEALGCERSWRVLALVPLGHPSREGYKTNRRPLSEVVDYR